MPRILIRGGTAAEWTDANPILAARELGVEVDTHQAKVGDGTTEWNDLEYIGGDEAAEVAADLAAHIADATAAHAASAIAFTPAAGISATTVQGAIEEVIADIEGSDVDSVNGRTGTVTGLAEQSDLVAETAARIADVDAEESRALAAEALLAPKANAALTGNPTAPTPSPGDADTSIATTGFVTDAVATAVTGLLDYRNVYDASGNAFPSSGGSGVGGAVAKSDWWIVSVAGTLGGSAVTAGDWVVAKQDAPGQTAGNWSLVEMNIGYAPENVANKSTDGTLAANSDTLYPSQKAVVSYAGLVYDAAVSVAALDATAKADAKVLDSIADADTTHAPSRNAVFDALAAKAPLASPVGSGVASWPAITAPGLTGAVAASRWVGGTAAVAPTTGTFLQGDWVTTLTGRVWICTVAGSPGTWVEAGSGTYVPVTRAAQGICISADQMRDGTGLGTTPTIGILANRFSCWLMDGSTAERVVGEINFPTGFGPVDIDLMWSNAGAGSGTIIVDLYLTPFADGDAAGKSSTNVCNDLTITAPAQNVVKITRLATGITVTPGFNFFMLDRLAAGAGGTLANDAAFIALRFTGPP